MLPETESLFPNAAFDLCEVHATLLKGVCYSHFGNGVVQWGSNTLASQKQ